MSEDGKPVSVSILDKEYLISCTDSERDGLLAAVRFVNEKMLELKQAGGVIGSERIAVMTALNLAHELLAHRRENENYTSTVDNAIRRLQTKIDSVLTKNERFDMSASHADM